LIFVPCITKIKAGSKIIRIIAKTEYIYQLIGNKEAALLVFQQAGDDSGGVLLAWGPETEVRQAGCGV
jgi:hypothetical protein